ncbi:hypothetical protein niasHS_000570 [Heterodera schachtii]|uniref:Protein SDA1 n=1 Tax=Heterodera schachtii TaxID=97005 RepID=A0ABD2K4M3_HETSC
MLENGPDEDWGCVGPDELFVNSGPTPSLLSLAARVESRHRLLNISKLNLELGQVVDKKEERTNEEEKTIRNEWEGTNGKNCATTDDGHKIPKEAPKMATARGAKNLKQLAFEVERFVAANLTDANERQSAEQRMVVALGAKPPRRKAINYRTLKEQRTEAKRKTMEGDGQQPEKDLWRMVKEGKVRKREGGRKRKNGSGVLKKWKKEKQKMSGRKKDRK